jgi:pyrrolidone-carboxylate peptidase
MSETSPTSTTDTTPHPAPAPVAPLTVEEQRLGVALVEGGSPLAAQVLAASGFEQRVLAFSAALEEASSLDDLVATVRSEASDLWSTAVARAQGRVATGHLDVYDDRPLYWARTSMSAALRRLDSPHLTLAHQRHGLLRLLDRRSRGIERDPGSSALWPTAQPGDVRVMVSGFDPYSLDLSVRHSNPSGAASLQLDGVRVPTAHGTACVRAVVLPVNYADFDEGVVEDAYGPALSPGAERADLITTISMTGRGRMDVERWAANARGGTPDNLRDQHFGPVARAARWPQPELNPEWIETTLPHEAMVAAGTGPWPVVLKRGIREWPAGTYPDPTTLVAAPDPSPGSTPAAGTGGDYLSNESMYRSNRLRLALGATDVPGGHLHISALEYPGDPALLTDPAFEADRRAVVDQTVALVAAAAAAVAGRRA